MLLKNLKTNTEIDFNTKRDERLAKRLASDPDFEIVSMTEEEKALLIEETRPEISLEDKLLGNLPKIEESKPKKGKK